MIARGPNAGPTAMASNPDGEMILNALPEPVLMLNAKDCVHYANAAAEQFLSSSFATLYGRRLDSLLPADSPVMTLIRQAREGEQTISEYELTIDTPRTGHRRVSIDVSPLRDGGGFVVLSMREQSIARRIDRQLSHRGAARSVTAMAGMLAHEVKNPLSGIRGAAQLLERGARQEDRSLTNLICEEADRIVKLVDRMEMFADQRPINRNPVNAHEVLEHVRRVAQSGFARHVTFVEDYDPSLPDVLGNRDLLIQVLLNLVKNAAEATPANDGRIRLSTRFRQGVRLAQSGREGRVELPLLITVEDNGPGIQDDIRRNLFDPFVTSKQAGKGLGLALVAKVVAAHGGIIEADSDGRRTRFDLLLPMAPQNLQEGQRI